MKNIDVLFEYQKFNPNSKLESKIKEVNSRFFSHGNELDDDMLDVAAAGEPFVGEKELDANRK